MIHSLNYLGDYGWGLGHSTIKEEKSSIYCQASDIQVGKAISTNCLKPSKDYSLFNIYFYLDIAWIIASMEEVEEDPVKRNITIQYLEEDKVNNIVFNFNTSNFKI